MKKITFRSLIWVAVAVVVLIAGYVVLPRDKDTEPTTKPDAKPVNESVTDIDGNIYKAIKIGNQTWMAENLKTIRYNDGQEIPQVTSSFEWGSLTTPGYCWLDNKATNKDAYGAFYNWYTIESNKLAPKGWHVPSDKEWATLSRYLGGDSVAGGKLKEKGTTHWLSPNSGATNESGFTALPCGNRNYDGLEFYKLGDGGYYWTSTQFDSGQAWVRSMLCDSMALKSSSTYKSYGRSVRCIKDAPV